MGNLDPNAIVSVVVVRGVDEHDRITDDPTRITEGELELTYLDGNREIVSIFRRLEARPAIVSA
jgi:hypothetical protein